LFRIKAKKAVEFETNNAPSNTKNTIFANTSKRECPDGITGENCFEIEFGGSLDN